jgi:hypothetical protein
MRSLPVMTGGESRHWLVERVDGKDTGLKSGATQVDALPGLRFHAAEWVHAASSPSF